MIDNPVDKIPIAPYITPNGEELEELRNYMHIYFKLEWNKAKKGK